MTRSKRIQAFSQLGIHLNNLSEEAFNSLAESARLENAWFTVDSVRMSLKGIGQYLQEDELTTWLKPYPEPSESKTIALVLAGNIPLVGFHDFLCALIIGHKVQIKLSSKDSKLFNYLIKQLIWLEPEFQNRIEFKDRLESFDAIIATGSDNTARYFEYYFNKYPNIIRKNRTSCAILTGNETDGDLDQLGTDIFSYFGLGCRNVSKVFAPEGYDFKRLLSSLDRFKNIIHHHKYCNNYDYQKSIMLVNGSPFLDNGFLMLLESDKLVSPISVLYFESYKNQEDLINKLNVNSEKIQCIVGNESPAIIPFGQAQFPRVWDYADQIDTLKFLSELK